MDNEQMTVPYIVFEGSMARSERHIKRLVIALVISVVATLFTNLAWLYLWNSYEYVGESTSYSQDGEGVNIIGDRNNYGTESDVKKNKIPQEKER